MLILFKMLKGREKKSEAPKKEHRRIKIKQHLIRKMTGTKSSKQFERKPEWKLAREESCSLVVLWNLAHRSFARSSVSEFFFHKKNSSLSHLVEADVEFRGSRDTKGRRKLLFKTFPWSTLASSLFAAQCTLDGWPIEVRLPGDPTNTKGTLHGLKQFEIEQIATALDENRIMIIRWTEGKQVFLPVFIFVRS